MKQTAMQDLREDLILTQTSAEESLLEIENQEIREACQEVISLTLKNIIKRIDEELLEMEKQQIIDSRQDGYECTYAEYGETPKCYLDGNNEQYYNETFKEIRL